MEPARVETKTRRRLSADQVKWPLSYSSPSSKWGSTPFPGKSQRCPRPPCRRAKAIDSPSNDQDASRSSLPFGGKVNWVCFAVAKLIFQIATSPVGCTRENNNSFPSGDQGKAPNALQAS